MKNVSNENPGIDGERSLPDVNSARRSQNNGVAILFVFFAIIVLIIYGYFSFFSSNKNEKIEEPEVVAKRINTRGNLIIDELPSLPEKMPPEPEIKTEKEDLVNNIKDIEYVSPIPEVKPPIIDHTRSSLMIFTNDKKKNNSDIALSDSEAVPDFNFQENRATNLGNQMISTNTELVTAKKIQHPNYTLSKGTLINCSLQTKIDSSLPGFVSCITTRDIYSDTGRILLLERGSQVVGEYQNSVENGLNRIFVLWTRIRTPNGITVDIDSPAADSLGGSGASGQVESRFWQRFGTALLLSMVDQGVVLANDLARIEMATRNGQGGNNGDASVNFDIGSVTSPLSETINSILRKQANIPDIMIKNQGENISIFVARDLDFSTVYDVKPY